MQRMIMWRDISVGKKYDNMETPVNLTDYEQYDYLTAFFFLQKKEAENKVQEHEQDRYEIIAIHPDKSNERYHMLVTYVMPCDVLIDWLKSTEYRVVSIRKLRKQKGNK